MMRSLSLRCESLISAIIDWFDSLPDALAFFILSFLGILAVVAGIACAVFIGVVAFSVHPLAGWVWTVICTCAILAGLMTLLEGI